MILNTVNRYQFLDYRYAFSQNMRGERRFHSRLILLRGQMTPEERARMEYLGGRIAVEKDPEVFDKLVQELNELLELKHQRIHPEHAGKLD